MMNKKIIFRVVICVSLIFSLFSGRVLGATYDANAMTNRDFVYDSNGNAYVKYGDPVICDPGAGAGPTITESYQDAAGNLHYIPDYSTSFNPDLSNVPSDVIIENNRSCLCDII